MFGGCSDLRGREIKESKGFVKQKQIMAPASNWLSFSLSPMEMLRSSESQYITYESSSTASPHYLIDNFYANGKPTFFFPLSVLDACLAAEKLREKEG